MNECYWYLNIKLNSTHQTEVEIAEYSHTYKLPLKAQYLRGKQKHRIQLNRVHDIITTELIQGVCVCVCVCSLRGRLQMTPCVRFLQEPGFQMPVLLSIQKQLFADSMLSTSWASQLV